MLPNDIKELCELTRNIMGKDPRKITGNDRDEVRRLSEFIEKDLPEDVTQRLTCLMKPMGGAKAIAEGRRALQQIDTGEPLNRDQRIAVRKYVDALLSTLHDLEINRDACIETILC